MEQFAFLSFGCDAHGCFPKPFLPFSPKFSLGVGLTAVSPSLGAEPGRALLFSTLRLSLWPARRRLLRGGERNWCWGRGGRAPCNPSTPWRRGVRLLDDRFGETLFVLCGSSAEKRRAASGEGAASSSNCKVGAGVLGGVLPQTLVVRFR